MNPALPLPFSPRLARTARGLDLEVIHAQHPFLLGVTARRLVALLSAGETLAVRVRAGFER